jgi:hypothetical protein
VEAVGQHATAAEHLGPPTAAIATQLRPPGAPLSVTEAGVDGYLRKVRLDSMYPEVSKHAQLPQMAGVALLRRARILLALAGHAQPTTTTEGAARGRSASEVGVNALGVPRLGDKAEEALALDMAVTALEQCSEVLPSGRSIPGNISREMLVAKLTGVPLPY